jgi:hypothetical protein
VDPISQPNETPIPPAKGQRGKPGLWGRIGGRSLTIAIVFHAILLVIGAIWVFEIRREKEKTVDFMPGDGNAGGSERGIEYKVQQKKQAAIIPTASAKRVFADGAFSTFTLPAPGDTFGEMSKLSSISGGGMSGGLGGSGGGKGFGRGSGNGTGGTGLRHAMMFGLKLDNSEKLAVVMDVSRSMTKYLPIVVKELDKLSSRGPLILYFGCGLTDPPPREKLDSRVHHTSSPTFDRFWQNWQGKASLKMKQPERDQLKYDPNAPMPLAAIHKQMSNRPDTYFIDFNGIRHAQTALMCDELKDADTIYWFADFMDKADAEVMKKVLNKLKSRKQKLYLHATVNGKFFETVRDGLAIPSGGKVMVKDVK